MSYKNAPLSCKCNTRAVKYYCIDCKLLICENCNLEEHKKHLILQKSNFILNKENINKAFEPVDQLLSESNNINFGKGIKDKLIQNIEKFFLDLEDRVKRFKDSKTQDIEKIFDNYTNSIKNARQRIKESKDKVEKHYERFRRFFLLDDFEREKLEHNVEQTNLVFLLNYDLLYLSQMKSLEVEKVIKQMIKYIETFEANQLEQHSNYLKQFDTIFFTQKEDTSNRSEAFSPIKFMENCNKMNEDHYKAVIERMDKCEKQIEAFKKSVFTEYKKTGNLKEIERIISGVGNSKQKGIDNLFSKRRPANTTTSRTSKVFVKDSSNNVVINKKEDICLNTPLLEKYFACYIMKLYADLFREEVKKEQNSHTDIGIKGERQETDKKIGKIKEGTNEIQIFDPSNKGVQLEKHHPNLSKNPYGYTKFPFGCRGLLVNDKFFITGGKDESRTYPNFIIYFLKTKMLQRMTDLRVPRSYHTMVYNETLSTVIVIGGENQSSVEILDPVTNRWLLMPELFYPRANPFFYFDEANGLMYTMFGSEGNINENTYTDVIEYLDLTKIKEGWFRFEYNNKSNLNLRSYLNVVPLNHEIYLLYGAVSPRGSKKTVCVLNLSKGEVGKVDKSLIEAIRREAQTNSKMNSIVSSITINNEG